MSDVEISLSRLLYGRRSGVEAVDTLTVIAHDRFDEVIRGRGYALRADSYQAVGSLG
jgi:hypothetical protein